MSLQPDLEMTENLHFHRRQSRRFPEFRRYTKHQRHHRNMLQTHPK